MPQKKFLGNGISEESSNCLGRELARGAELAVPAFEDVLQPDSTPAGREAAMPAARAECANSRRVRRKVGCGSSKK